MLALAKVHQEGERKDLLQQPLHSDLQAPGLEVEGQTKEESQMRVVAVVGGHDKAVSMLRAMAGCLMQSLSRHAPRTTHPLLFS